MTHAILCSPGHNRVYFEASLKLSVAEFTIVSRGLSASCKNVSHRNICGIQYLTFDTDSGLSREDLSIISGLSFAYGLFAVEGIYLRPVELVRDWFVDENMSAILKYTGKTNEIFTRMLLNVARYSGGQGSPIRVLDPVAGKGTTLYEGLVKGFNVYGIEISDGVVNECYHYIKKFLENAKYKFEHNALKISGENKAFTALRHTFTTARNKIEQKEGNTRTIEVIAGNSLYADKFYKKNYFDMIVGDLPYGVQHGAVSNEKQSKLTRNPGELVRTCLPSWVNVLKPGGVVTLSWNVNTLSRKKLTEILEENGLNVLIDGVYPDFEHRVDQAIVRDIIVATKK